MRVMIKAAAAAVVLLIAAPALALTTAGPSAASFAGARFLHDQASLAGPISNLQGAVVGFGLRTDGQAEFSGDTAGSYGYLTSAEPSDPSKAVASPSFQDELPTTYRTPGVTVYYGMAPGGRAAATPQATR